MHHWMRSKWIQKNLSILSDCQATSAKWRLKVYLAIQESFILIKRHSWSLIVTQSIGKFQKEQKTGKGVLKKSKDMFFYQRPQTPSRFWDKQTPEWFGRNENQIKFGPIEKSLQPLFYILTKKFSWLINVHFHIQLSPTGKSTQGRNWCEIKEEENVKGRKFRNRKRPSWGNQC